MEEHTILKKKKKKKKRYGAYGSYKQKINGPQQMS